MDMGQQVSHTYMNLRAPLLIRKLPFAPPLTLCARELSPAMKTYPSSFLTPVSVSARRSSIKDISVSVKDTDCDGKYVYIYLKYQYVSNLGTLAANVLRYENRSGCSGGYKVKNTPTFKAGRTIRNIRVFVCRSDALSDTCYSSGYYKNPKV